MFPIVLLGAKTKTGLELALKCIEFYGTESVNSIDPVLNFKSSQFSFYYNIVISHITNFRT